MEQQGGALKEFKFINSVAANLSVDHWLRAGERLCHVHESCQCLVLRLRRPEDTQPTCYQTLIAFPHLLCSSVSGEPTFTWSLAGEKGSRWAASERPPSRKSTRARIQIARRVGAVNRLQAPITWHISIAIGQVSSLCNGGDRTK